MFSAFTAQRVCSPPASRFSAVRRTLSFLSEMAHAGSQLLQNASFSTSKRLRLFHQALALGMSVSRATSTTQ